MPRRLFAKKENFFPFCDNASHYPRRNKAPKVCQQPFCLPSPQRPYRPTYMMMYSDRVPGLFRPSEDEQSCCKTRKFHVEKETTLGKKERSRLFLHFSLETIQYRKAESSPVCKVFCGLQRPFREVSLFS